MRDFRTTLAGTLGRVEIEPPPIAELIARRSRRDRRRSFRVLTIATIAAAVILATAIAFVAPSSARHSPLAGGHNGTTISTATPSTSTVPIGPGPDLFVARSDRQGKLGLFSASTGRLVRWLLAEPFNGMSVEATAVDRTGRIWVTLASGPTCPATFAYCRPTPDSCTGEVAVVNPTTLGVKAVLRATRSELIGDARPSPDGRYLAYLDGNCDRGALDQYIRVRDLSTGASWTIGAGLTPCHLLGSLSWTPDGQDLAVQYGPSLATSTTWTPAESDGFCPSWGPTELAVVSARTSQPGLDAQTASADPACAIEALTATRTGYAAIEGCGEGPLYISGATRLLRYSRRLVRSAEATLGACIDGAELVADQDGSDLLGTTYQFCAMSGAGVPTTVAFTDGGAGPRTFYDQPNGGEDAFSDISW